MQEGTLGGITLFKDNATDLEQLAKLTGDIIEASQHIPVLTVDQEGGAVQRFDHVISALPSPMALAALYKGESSDDQIIEKITAISARQLKTLGFQYATGADSGSANKCQKSDNLHPCLW